MKSNIKVDREILPRKTEQTQQVTQIRELSKEDLKEVSGGCGKGMVAVKF
jgi:bacteriocin-like protein